MPQRQQVEVVRQQVVALLADTLAQAEALCRQVERPVSLGRASMPPKGAASSAQAGRKRRRQSSPVEGCATVRCFSEHLALPKTPTQDLLPCLSGELRGHLLAGVKWLSTLDSHGLCGILADELQHDRQVQVVGLYAYLKSQGVGGPFLIVAGSDTLQSWAADLHRLLPQGIVHNYDPAVDGSRDMLTLLCSRQGDDPSNPVTRVVLMSHETFCAEASLICQHTFKHVVLDVSNQAAALQNLELTYMMAGRPKVLLLTGCRPAQGQGQFLQELWPLLRLTLPESWEYLYAAVNRLSEVVHATGMPTLADEILPGIVSMLQNIVDCFVLSRTCEEVDLGQQRRELKICLYDLYDV